MNAILLKHNSIRSYLLSSITSGSLRFSPSSFYFFSIRHGHSSKPSGHARSILNILSKKPPNPNMLSSSSALPSPINIDHKLPSLQEKSPPNISSSSLPTNSSAYSDNKLPVLNSTTSRKHLNDLIPSSVNPIKTTSNSIPSTVQQQGLGNALITAGSNLFFSDKYAKPKSSSVVVHQAPKDLTPEQLHIRHKQETIIVNVDILKRMPPEEVYNDKYLLDQYKTLINNSPHFVLNRQGQMFMELCYSRRVFPQELVSLYSQFKINDIIGKNNNMVEITTFFNVLAIETIASRYPEIARLLNIQIIPTCIPSHNLKTISHNAESLLYMNNSVKYTKNSTSDLLFNNIPFDFKTEVSFTRNYIVFMDHDCFYYYKKIPIFLFQYEKHLMMLVKQTSNNITPFQRHMLNVVRMLNEDNSRTNIQKQDFFNREAINHMDIMRPNDTICLIIPITDTPYIPNELLSQYVRKIKMDPSRSGNSRVTMEQIAEEIKRHSEDTQRISYMATRGAYGCLPESKSPIDHDILD